MEDKLRIKVINRMKELGVSRYEFCKVNAMSESTLSRWLNGNTIHLDTFLKIVDALELKIELTNSH